MLNKKWRFWVPAICILISIGYVINIKAQGGGNIVYGDLRIDSSKTHEKVPSTFYVLLSSGRSISAVRQPAAPGGRFRFIDVPNGEYDLIVELEGREVAKMHINIQPPTPTDFRYDLELAWTDTISQSQKPSTVSALYPRMPAQQKLFDEVSTERNEEKAVAILEQIVKNDPKDFVAWTDLGTRYFRLKKEDEAVRAFETAVAEKGDFLLALVNLGQVQIARKAYEKAADTLIKAVIARPTSPEANYFLGEAFLNLKKGTMAVVYFNQALRLAPNEMAEAHLRLALLYNAAGYKDRAAAEYEQFLVKRPDFKEKAKLQQYINANKKS